jgi:hypothetical protein
MLHRLRKSCSGVMIRWITLLQFVVLFTLWVMLVFAGVGTAAIAGVDPDAVEGFEGGEVGGSDEVR